LIQHLGGFFLDDAAFPLNCSTTKKGKM